MPETNINYLTGIIVHEAVQLHMALGPGLLESVYETVLARTLVRKGLRVERQKAIQFEYDGIQFTEGFRADLLVNSIVMVELKSVEKLSPVHGKQLLTYLKLARLSVGLLLNFGAPVLKDGLKRVVNDLIPETSTLLRVNRQTNRAPIA